MKVFEFPDSESIASISYDEVRSELTVHFVKGTTYLYSGVAAGVFDNFKSAPSAGRFFRDAILKRYKFERVN